MAQDDMTVVVCKVLKYLSDCGKAGMAPDPERLSPEELGIPRRWWATCLCEVIRNGFATGIHDCSTTAGKDALVSPDAAITLAGAEHLSDNSAMRRAYGWLKEVRGFLPL